MDGAKTEMKFIFRMWLGISYLKKIGHEFSEGNLFGVYLLSKGRNENRIGFDNYSVGVFGWKLADLSLCNCVPNFKILQVEVLDKCQIFLQLRLKKTIILC